MKKQLILTALMCLVCLCSFASCISQSAQKSARKLNPMESVVCSVDNDYSIVRNDETRRNVFTLRHTQTLEPAFETKFEKYLDTFSLDGKPFIAVASWNPAFGYLWAAWIRDGKNWKQLLPMQYTELKVIEEEGQPTRLQCTDHNGETATHTLQDLLTQ